VLDFITKGDVLMVTRVDRLAHSIGDLQDIVRMLKTKGASLRATEQPIDTSTAAGKCFLDMLGVFAEFKTNPRRERQLEGIAKANAAGVYRGRKPSIDQGQVEKLKADGFGATEIAKRLKIGRASVINLQVDIHYGDSDTERIAAVAKELVAAQPEVLQVGTTPGTTPVLKETRTIPVVFTVASDPVGEGFVQSLPHPGGNATGFINIESSLHGRQMAPAPQGGDAAGAAGDGAVRSHNRAPDGLLSASDRGGCAVLGNHDKDGSGQRYGRDGKGNRDYRPG